MTARVSVASSALDQIAALAQASPEREICGLLLGGDGAVANIAPTPNVASDPAKGFAICPRAHARAQRESRIAGLAIVGCYHSHPSGGVEPSGVDLLAAQDNGFIWIIAAPDGRIAAWRAVLRRGVKYFAPLEIDAQQTPVDRAALGV